MEKLSSKRSGSEETFIDEIAKNEEFTNIRKLKMLIKKINSFTKNEELISQINFDDLFDLTLLEITNYSVYKQLMKNPNIIFDNNVVESPEFSNTFGPTIIGYFLTNFGSEVIEHKTKNVNDVSKNYAPYDEFYIKSEYKKYKNTLLRKQLLNYKQVKESQLRITNE
jgi:hypothetical protein